MQEKQCELCGICIIILDPSRLRETRVIRSILSSLPDPEKVPLHLWIAQNLCHSRWLSANGMKFAQFASNSLYLSTKLTRTTVSLKVDRHFVIYDNSCLNYSLRLSHE